MGRQFNQPGYTFPEGHRRPDEVYDDVLALRVGGVRIELFHGRGETDSPQARAIQATRARVYERCTAAETSLIGKAIFAVYQREAKVQSTF
jgi:hypothetical protein